MTSVEFRKPTSEGHTILPGMGIPELLFYSVRWRTSIFHKNVAHVCELSYLTGEDGGFVSCFNMNVVDVTTGLM